MPLYAGDDLTPLLAPTAPADLGLHQGVIQAWDNSTGTNTITVAGATLTDVPVLNTGSVVTLQAGQVVAVLRWKTSYFVLGRITAPGQV